MNVSPATASASSASASASAARCDDYRGRHRNRGRERRRSHNYGRSTTNATSVTVDNSNFEVSGGNLKLKAGTSLDFETVGSSVDVTITASGDGASATHTVTVTVNDVNEAPGAPALVDPNATLAVDENDDGATVTSLEAPTDPDAGDTVTLTVDDSRFEITSARIIKLKDGQKLDHEMESSVALVITATDSGGLTATTNITVTVNDINEAPAM